MGGGGGGGGGSRGIGDLQSLVDRAKKTIQEGQRRNVFLSFAHEDLSIVNLLRAQAKNDKTPLEFNDWSVTEPIDSERAPYIRQKITERIAQSSVTVVFLSAQTSQSAWVNWEIEESVRLGKHVVGVYPQNSKPAAYPTAISRRNIPCVPWPDLADTISRLP